MQHAVYRIWQFLYADALHCASIANAGGFDACLPLLPVLPDRLAPVKFPSDYLVLLTFSNFDLCALLLKPSGCPNPESSLSSGLLTMYGTSRLACAYSYPIYPFVKNSNVFRGSLQHSGSL